MNWTENSPDKMPSVLQIIPLHDNILLPRTEIQISLMAFVDFISMKDLSKRDQIFGFVPVSPDGHLFHSGCAGHFKSVQHTEEAGPTVFISGICRFDIVHVYRKDNKSDSRKKNSKNILADVSYDRFTADIVQEADFKFDRKKFVLLLRNYCQKKNIQPNWKLLDNISNDRLLTLLMVMCPFHLQEKQTLLETSEYTDQISIMESIMEMDIASSLQPTVANSSILYH